MIKNVSNILFFDAPVHVINVHFRPLKKVIKSNKNNQIKSSGTERS